MTSPKFPRARSPRHQTHNQRLQIPHKPTNNSIHQSHGLIANRACQSPGQQTELRSLSSAKQREITISGIRLPCHHIFCEECTFNWFHPRKFRNGCPSCYTEFFEILYVDEDDAEEFEDGGDEEDDDELSGGAQGLEDEDEAGDESFEIARFDHEVEDGQMTSERECSVGEVESLRALGGRGCAAAAAATTAALEMSQVARSRTCWLSMYLSANDFSKHDRVDGEVSGLGSWIGYDSRSN